MDKTQQPQHSIGEVVKIWREHRKLKPVELAKAADLSPAYLSQLEHNKIRQPRELALAKLAEALDIEAIDMITRRMPPAVKTATEYQSLAQHATNKTSSYTHLHPEAVGAHVVRMLATASLSEREIHLVGEQIIDLTENIVQLMTTARRLPRAEYSSVQETQQPGT